MAQRRRRHLQRDALVFLASLAAHLVFFYLLASEFTFYQLPEAPAVQVEIVPELSTPPPQPPPKPEIIRVPRPVPIPPLPTPQTKPQEQPQPTPAPQPALPQPAVKPTAPIKLAPTPAPTPPVKPATVPSPIAPAAPTAEPGPPQAVPQSAIVAAQPHMVAAPTLKLHKSQSQLLSPLAPSLSLPGAQIAQPSPAQTPGGSAAGAGGGGGSAGTQGLPRGSFGFGSGLRGSLIGCVNADTVKLTEEERAKCAERFGAGTRVAPVMDPIGASKRSVLDDEAQGASTAAKYRDSAPTGTVDQPIAGQPRAMHSPAQ